MADTNHNINIKWSVFDASKVVSEQKKIADSLMKNLKVMDKYTKLDTMRSQIMGEMDAYKKQDAQVQADTKKKERLEKVSTRQSVQQERLNKQVAATRDRVSSLSSRWTRLLYGTRAVDHQTGKMRWTFSRFRMELLGSLFAMQGLSQAMFSLLAPAAEATGFTKVWSTMMMAYFAPGMAKITGLLAKFMGWILDMPNSTKEWITYGVATVGVFAAITSAIASLLLAAPSLMGLFYIIKSGLLGLGGTAAASGVLMALGMDPTDLEEKVNSFWIALKGWIIVLSDKLVAWARTYDWTSFWTEVWEIMTPIAIAGASTAGIAIGSAIYSGIKNGVKSGLFGGPGLIGPSLSDAAIWSGW